MFTQDMTAEEILVSLGYMPDVHSRPFDYRIVSVCLTCGAVVQAADGGILYAALSALADQTEVWCKDANCEVEVYMPNRCDWSKSEIGKLATAPF